jgi:hypothetical protein
VSKILGERAAARGLALAFEEWTTARPTHRLAE